MNLSLYKKTMSAVCWMFYVLLFLLLLFLVLDRILLTDYPGSLYILWLQHYDLMRSH